MAQEGSSAAATPWTEGADYSAGQIVSSDGAVYRCLQAHTAQANWNPKDAVTLWSLLPSGPDQVPTQIGAPGTVDPLDVPYGAAESGETNTTGKVSAPVAPASAAQVSGRDWHLGASYAVGDVCTYQGQSYQCRQAHHVDAADWIPPNTPSLWLPVDAADTPPPWAQGTTYSVDERCSYSGQNYTCRQGHTAYASNWTPNGCELTVLCI